jgi:ABC-type dipeptide/oligopeptide/nickel transport system ATPase subunit
MNNLAEQEIFFDDFLNLRNEDFENIDLAVFFGESGSGKSTAMYYLANHHPFFTSKKLKWLADAPARNHVMLNNIEVVFIDEVINTSDIVKVIHLLRKNIKVVMATHLPYCFFLPLRIFWRIKAFPTDRNEEKIRRYLQQKSISSTPEAVRRFCKKYGATYTDIDIILERYPERSFDLALKQFEKFCKISK